MAHLNILWFADSSHSNGRYRISDCKYGFIAKPIRSTINDNMCKTCNWNENLVKKVKEHTISGRVSWKKTINFHWCNLIYREKRKITFVSHSSTSWSKLNKSKNAGSRNSMNCSELNWKSSTARFSADAADSLTAMSSSPKQIIKILIRKR